MRALSSPPEPNGTLPPCLAAPAPFAADDLTAADVMAWMLELLAKNPDLDTLLAKTVPTLTAQIGGDSAGIWLADPGLCTNRFVLEYDSGQITYASQLTAPPPTSRQPRSALLGDPWAYDDIEQAADLAPQQEFLQMRRVKSLVVVPLHSDRHWIRALGIRSKERRRYRPAELRRARELAYPMALAVQLVHFAADSRRRAVQRQRAQLTNDIDDAVAKALNEFVEPAGIPRAVSSSLPTSAAARRDAPTLRHGQLTGRQREVLQLLADGCSNREIGSALGITEGTAKAHVASVLDKLGVGSRTEAVTLGLRLGLVQLASLG